MIQQLVITRGYPASGKTTYARKWVSEATGRAKAPSRDDLRESLYGKSGVLIAQQENDVTAAQKSAVEALLGRSLSVIIDDTNLRPSHARNWADFAQVHGVDFEVADIKTDLTTCLERNAGRWAAGGRLVPPEAIEKMAVRFPISKWETITPRGALNIAPYVPDPDNPTAWIFDVDGTLAHHGTRSPYDYSRVLADEIDPYVANLAETLHWSSAPVLVVSGRPDSCRADTEKWLRDKHISYGELFMRRSGDARNDAVVKLEIFNEHIRNSYNVLGVFDDRNRVVAMWRRLGLKCFQVAEGDF